MPAKTVRKILKTGGSRLVALPSDWLRALKLDAGDTVEILYDFIVLIKPRGMRLDIDLLLKELEALARLEEARDSSSRR